MATIAEIKAALPILDAAHRYLPGLHVKRKGSKYWGLCPWHFEKTASFSIDPDKSRAKCWGCGWSGDAFDLATQALGVPLAEAVKIVAADLGLSGSDSPRPTRREIERQHGLARITDAFEVRRDEAYRFAAHTLRVMETVISEIQKEADLERSDVIYALLYRTDFEYLLDLLASDDPEDQFRGMLTATSRGF